METREGREAEEAREMLESIISLQSLNREFEAKHGLPIDQACFESIEDGNYQPVLEHITRSKKILSSLPADSETARFLKAYIKKYLDAMDERDKRNKGRAQPENGPEQGVRLGDR